MSERVSPLISTSLFSSSFFLLLKEIRFETSSPFSWKEINRYTVLYNIIAGSKQPQVFFWVRDDQLFLIYNPSVRPFRNSVYIFYTPGGERDGDEVGPQTDHSTEQLRGLQFEKEKKRRSNSFFLFLKKGIHACNSYSLSWLLFLQQQQRYIEF